MGRKRQPYRYVFICALLLAVIGCGGNAQAPMSTTAPPQLPAVPPPPPPPHIGIVIFENESYDMIVGNSAMPYLNSLIAQGGLATSYFANTHTSLPDYFMLTTGNLVTTTNGFSGIITDDNVVRRLVAATKTWKSYLEALPSVGYTGGDTGTYVKHHNPFAYISDVINDPQQITNMVPLPQLATDLAAAQLPNYFFIVPDDTHNSHDCPPGITTCTTTDKLAAADQWLKANITALLASPEFQANGVLVITFDESILSDTANGGGHIATVIVGSGIKPGFRSTMFYQHQSTLRLTLQLLGITSYPGAAASAPDMKEFFQ